ncbi:MAG: hypothetical protein OMM_13934 [Candidatus Magnetoglobus multicellularis str. Araruama]|uniref:Uncharacterized protein n=1 Tax=Candidatus Magnetoglobus multicellularis str. Araruama TaxID=890399 RepID=A0A1V1NSV0_9BACT|nr:MAG: hypothetical protein OMM_13934 [Candidatus Magnetoglobus multicellularis str. Araruama]
MNLSFIWSYRANAVDRPGFCLDDISISGTISSKPVIYKPILTSPTDLLAPMHSEFSYTVSAYNTNGYPVDISLYYFPGWLKIQSSDTNNIVLNGFPDFPDIVLENLQNQ